MIMPEPNEQTVLFINALKRGEKQRCLDLLEEHGNLIDIHANDSLLPRLEEDYCNSYVRGGSPIIVAAEYPNNEEIIQKLIEYGANVNDRNWNGLTPLMKAAISNNVSNLEVLVSNGANIHARIDVYFASAILYASLHNSIDAMKYLMTVGANIHDKTRLGSTCYNVTYNVDTKAVIEKWPLTMAIIMFEELNIYNVAFDSLFDLYAFT
jgi:ankyrin repeat protein